jgi:hypothetical protein
MDVYVCSYILARSFTQIFADSYRHSNYGEHILKKGETEKQRDRETKITKRDRVIQTGKSMFFADCQTTT